MHYFQIPKLELMHSVMPSITSSGAVIQWSADITEQAHISEVKVPSWSGNNQSYNLQICQWLDQSEKHRNFSLTLTITHSQPSPDEGDPDLPDQDLISTGNNNDDDTDNNHKNNNNNNNSNRNNSKQVKHQDLFTRVAWLSSNITPSTPLPLHTFYTKTTAFRA
jgi:hypothetical protein